MTIPKVKHSSVDSVRDAYDREGIPYIKNMINEIAEKQPVIAEQISGLLHHLEERMENGGVDEKLQSYILENIGYRSFAMFKSLYIQKEVNELEEQAHIISGVINEEE